jgi:hypothetical protein
MQAFIIEEQKIFQGCAARRPLERAHFNIAEAKAESRPPVEAAVTRDAFKL